MQNFPFRADARTITALYNVTSRLKTGKGELSGWYEGKTIVSYWTYRGRRPGNHLLYESLIEDYVPENRHAMVAIDELLTQDEAHALKDYLDHLGVVGETLVKEARLPFPSNVGSVARFGDYHCFEVPETPLPFQVTRYIVFESEEDGLAVPNSQSNQ